MKVLLATILLTASAFAQKAPQIIEKSDGGHCCPVIHGVAWWPFQSWTHKWSCIRGETEAKSTWHLYQPELNLEFILAPIDYKTAWYVQYNVDGQSYKCDKYKREDGLVHSLIIGQEYTQTCEDGKLGLLVPVQ